MVGSLQPVPFVTHASQTDPSYGGLPANLPSLIKGCHFARLLVLVLAPSATYSRVFYPSTVLLQKNRLRVVLRVVRFH